MRRRTERSCTSVQKCAITPLLRGRDICMKIHVILGLACTEVQFGVVYELHARVSVAYVGDLAD